MSKHVFGMYKHGILRVLDVYKPCLDMYIEIENGIGWMDSRILECRSVILGMDSGILECRSGILECRSGIIGV